MYQKYWNFNEKPFENTPNPRFLYHSAEHDEAYIRLLYAINSLKGAAMLSGEYGCGKTLLMHTLINELPKEQYNVAFLTNPRWSANELIGEILYQLQIDYTSTVRMDMLHALNDNLVATFKKGMHTIIIIDEAQTINQKETFEELRMLLNFQFNDRFLLTLLLIGQPELKDIVADIPQLEQRIAVRYHLRRFDLHDTEQYINYRLSKAGARDQIFTTGAIHEIHKYSQGIPRKINNICDLSLLLGFGQKLTKLESEHIISIINSEG